MTTDHFNKLSPAEAERLAMVAEECAEVIHIISKILRHGYQSHHPDDATTTNRKLLHLELCDLLSCVDRMATEHDIVRVEPLDVLNAWKRKHRYTHHQPPLGPRKKTGVNHLDG